jgi:hypothetical protein
MCGFFTIAIHNEIFTFLFNLMLKVYFSSIAFMPKSIINLSKKILRGHNCNKDDQSVMQGEKRCLFKK